MGGKASEFPKVIIIQTEAWSCGIDGHKHRTEAIARKCMEKERRGPRVLKWTDALYEEALKFRESGKTYREVGEKYGVGYQRGMDICHKAERLRRRREAAGLPHPSS